jgi:CheY-like chemotaxis protein
MKIFYVDDDHEDRQFFCEVIDEILPGSSCEMVADGEQAIRKLKGMKIHPDYIFLDLGMPVMDGMSCLREIKRNDKLRSIPVVIFSSSLNTDFHADLKKLGAAQVILKPSTYADWGKALSIVLKPTA